jgi:calcium-dependent protein kinase
MGACTGKGHAKGQTKVEVTHPTELVKRLSNTMNALTKKETPPVPGSRSFKGDGITRSQFILNNPGNVKDIYDIESKKLGEGTYGSVSRGTHKSTGVVRAIKTLSKGHTKNLQRFRQEIAIMKVMDHPNIIKLFETFEDRRNMYLVMELCQGGELFDRIIEAGHFRESDAATVVQQILHAICYMHKNGICHRDLKPENFLFLTKDPINKSSLKIIDFGLSTTFVEGQVLSTKAGTPYYVAPQVLQGKYDKMCDLWSCGVIMYTLLCGYPPFYGRTDQEVLAKVRSGTYGFEPKDWKNVSDDAKGLIRMLLKMDPAQRYTSEQALNHDWIRDRAPRAKEVNLQGHLVSNLKNFRCQNKLKKAALHIIAGQMSESQIKGLRETFEALDVNGDGLLTMDELQAGISNANLQLSGHDLAAIMEGVDSDGSGLIDYTEFLAATLDRKSYLQEDVCWTAFSVFDQNGDGQITLEELKSILETGSVNDALDGRTSEEILQDVDTNGDGSIDFQEFMEMMRGGRASGLSLQANTPKASTNKVPISGLPAISLRSRGEAGTSPATAVA